MNLAKADIQYLPGLGPKKVQVLNDELSIYSLNDLLHHFPYKYIDRSRFYKIREIEGQSSYIQLKGQITGFRKEGVGRKQRVIARFTDSSGSLDLIFFKGGEYIAKTFHLHTDYIIFGKPNFFNGKYSFVHPEIEKPTAANVQGFMPMYHTTEKMKSKYLHSKALQKLQFLALQKLDESLPETLPVPVLEKYKFLSLYHALRQVHFPQNMLLLEKARTRLKFEELFYIQLAILRQAHTQKTKTKAYAFDVVGDNFNAFYEKALPFDLTGAQKRVMKEIRADLRGPYQMNRLLQGDVGSGKTIVALLSMLIAIDNGYQVCLMAPTEILAIQHYESICALLTDMEVPLALLTGSVKKKDREGMHQRLREGSLPILIGTHAVLEDTVQFNNLGLVIIDEQHRFGVAQRAKLWAKNDRPPHVLVMTATPIPRTLAMTVYGDLQVSVIDELPPGRKPIVTKHVFENKRAKLINFFRQQMEEGRQIYVVYPLIQESEKIDLKNLEDGYKQMQEEFPDTEIAMVHGKMKPAEKEEQMKRFSSGQAKMLVATTVIEVGVNVPNATVMAIENAERFGLSQLHQLRGRVGRGGDQSYCLLVSSYELSADTRKRLTIMTETNDGFEIAEADMQLRGPGDLEGTAQSGLPFNLQIANLTKDGPILQLAREVVTEILEEDPNLSAPAHKLLLPQLKVRARGAVNWSVIS